jgi:hypothetical protein
VKPLVVTREMTKIEERILGSLLTLILQNLSLAWQSVATVAFSVESHESEPLFSFSPPELPSNPRPGTRLSDLRAELLQVMGPNEAIVVIANGPFTGIRIRHGASHE